VRLRFACRACEATVATGDLLLPTEVPCPVCGAHAVCAAPSQPGGVIGRCLLCGGAHLFIQKEFPRRLGLAITVAGAVAFLVLMGFERLFLGFGVLLGVALLDSLVYRAAPFMTVCYHCQTEFRRAPLNPEHQAYDPKIAFYTANQAVPARAPAEGGPAAPRP